MTATVASIGSSFGGGGGGVAASFASVDQQQQQQQQRYKQQHQVKMMQQQQQQIHHTAKPAAFIETKRRLESIPGVRANPEIHGSMAMSMPIAQHEASLSSSEYQGDDNVAEDEERAHQEEQERRQFIGRQRVLIPLPPASDDLTTSTAVAAPTTMAPSATAVPPPTMPLSFAAAPFSYSPTSHADRQQQMSADKPLQFVGVATVDEVARANAGGPIIPPSDRMIYNDRRQYSQQQRYVLVPEELVNSTLTPSSNGGSYKSGGSGSNPNNNDRMSASHALYISSPSSGGAISGNNPNSGTGSAIGSASVGDFITPSGSFGAPLPAVVPLRHLDLVGNPSSLVNFLMHWINRQCHWQSAGHARCVQHRLERIAAYANREQQAYLTALAAENAPPAELARYAALFGESQRTAQALIASLASKNGATISPRRIQSVLLDFPYAIGSQYLARYLLSQPDWNAMADDYKSIIVQSDFELLGDNELTTPDRMIAQMSRSSALSSNTN